MYYIWFAKINRNALKKYFARAVIDTTKNESKYNIITYYLIVEDNYSKSEFVEKEVLIHCD